MKTKAAKLKTVALIALVLGSLNSMAQVETIMYVMKNGEVVFQSPVSGVDNVTFDKASPDSMLIVNKNDGSSADKILLNDIQQLSFSDENLSVEMATGGKMYVFADITKLLFGDPNTTGISNPSIAKSSLDVYVHVTPAGDAIVKSSVPIQSLTLFDVDGQMISKRQYNRVETQCIMSLQGNPAGIYILRIETVQDAVVKKIVKP